MDPVKLLTGVTGQDEWLLSSGCWAMLPRGLLGVHDSPWMLVPFQVRLMAFLKMDFLGGAGGKELACQCRRRKRRTFNPWVRKIPWRRAWQPTPGFSPGESHTQSSLEGYRP